mmetsp:Transcript_2333/g.2275  ORF Transcript_2333/g.2275 Transcript_2333/m.2275 type:complete len:133 (-) Transcript_2333:172-570(-)|eukprot:CAMPEP_0170555898 /NCGR_PEP_ID=MMETSP0211-20121228/14557_1 /TAXON_ID=311385 /ORGANISM="Pseudokeronopsis sp., Strain OXSARD2" /LENGTH=132 /DNA_ID=CAMNT_0010865913 /DNA_START=295 /DNA_END=693 /DNA_ORIENTATION=-
MDKIWYKINKIRKPMIAAVNGICLGGGFELALFCDMIVASENAKFGFPEIKLGLLPGGQGTQRLPRLVGQSKAMELILTGDMISAEEAKNLKVVNQIYPDDKLMEGVMKLAKKIAKMGQLAAAFSKRAILSS